LERRWNTREEQNRSTDVLPARRGSHHKPYRDQPEIQDRPSQGFRKYERNPREVIIRVRKCDRNLREVIIRVRKRERNPREGITRVRKRERNPRNIIARVRKCERNPRLTITRVRTM
jgi:hypothetical protein